MLKMSGMLAHSLDSQRSRDISLEGNISFESLLLNENLLNGLTKNGYKKPSPIQIKAIPVGRCGFDVIVKSKSGTGKTLVFSIVALETVEVLKTQTQVLILAPTREIVVQIEEVISTVGTFIEGLHVTSFIGGLPIKEDIEKCKDCHIAVGAPGRVKHLITEGILKINSVRLLVLDEVDKLMENSFVNDINEIYNNLTGRVQVITTSATYTNEIKTFLHKFMLSPTQVVVEDETPLLWGLKQFVQVIDSHPNVVQQTKAKTDVILKILTRLSFTQCIIFTNYQIRAESISNTLNQKGHASLYISAARTQVERLAAVKDLRNFKCRIMLSTDLTARGIDAANVDLVINYDVPVDAVTYLHRMGRAGRYGSTGICINLVSRTGELQQLQNILNTIGGPSMSIPELPDFNGDIKDLLNLEVPNEKHILAISSDVITSKSNNTTANLNVENTSKKKKQKPVSKNKYTLEEHGNTEDKVANFLNSTKDIKSIPEIFETTDTQSILNSLAAGTLKFESNVSDNSTTSNLPELNLLSKTGTSLKNLDNPKLSTVDSKGNSFNKNLPPKEHLYHKNKALLCVAKTLSEQRKNIIMEEDLKCIENYLNILKEQESNEIQSIMKNTDKNDIDTLRKMLNKSPDSVSNHIEDIFKIGYECATGKLSEHWRYYFPDLDNGNSSLLLKEEISDYDETEKSCSEDLIDRTGDLRDEENPVADYMKWIPVEKSEAIDFEKVKMNNIQSNYCDTSREHFYTYFGNCSDNLWQYGLSFDSVENFDNWFLYEWQAYVYSIRNYVQQNIYIQEMNNYQNDQKINNSNILWICTYLKCLSCLFSFTFILNII